MPSALERRIDRLAGTLVSGAEARIRYCTNEAEAAGITAAAEQSGSPVPICIICGESAEGPTVREWLERAAASGRRIHDKPTGEPAPAREWRVFWHQSGRSRLQAN